MDKIHVLSAPRSDTMEGDLRSALHGLLQAWNAVSGRLPAADKLKMSNAVQLVLRRGFAVAPAWPAAPARIEKVENISLGHGWEGLLQTPRWRVLAGPPGHEKTFLLDTEDEAVELKRLLDGTISARPRRGQEVSPHRRRSRPGYSRQGRSRDGGNGEPGPGHLR